MFKRKNSWNLKINLNQKYFIMGNNISAVSAGSVDEDSFVKSFEEVPTLRIFSAREVTDHMKNILDIISDSNKEWNKRVDAVSKMSSLIFAILYEDF